MEFFSDGLVPNHVKYMLCPDEKTYKKALKQLNVPYHSKSEFLSKIAGAAVNFLSNEHGQMVALVCLDTEEDDQVEIYCRLAHEAVHVWQECATVIGEDSPSREFEAYAVESICRNLFNEYRKWKEKQMSCGKPHKKYPMDNGKKPKKK